MSEFCGECGQKLKSDAVFCPNCGKKVKNDNISNGSELTYEELIQDIIYVDGRISKAKAIGVGFFVLIAFSSMIALMPSAVRYGPVQFFITIFLIFLSGLIYYSICRGIGFIFRNYISK